jgi:hypothetical protein
VSLSASTDVPEHLFGFDTLADVSIVGEASLLSNFTPYNSINVRGVTGSARATGVGTLNLTVTTDHKTKHRSTDWQITLPDVLCIPGCENLLCASDVLSLPEVADASLKNGAEVGKILLNDDRSILLQHHGKRFLSMPNLL